MARHVVTVSGRYRCERFETTITDRRLVGAYTLRQTMRGVNRAFANLASAMGRVAHEVQVFSEYAKLPKGPAS